MDKATAKKILGITDDNFSANLVKEKFKEKALEFHPDRHPEASTEEITAFKKQFYQILKAADYLYEQIGIDEIMAMHPDAKTKKNKQSEIDLWIKELGSIGEDILKYLDIKILDLLDWLIEQTKSESSEPTSDPASETPLTYDKTGRLLNDEGRPFKFPRK